MCSSFFYVAALKSEICYKSEQKPPVSRVLTGAPMKMSDFAGKKLVLYFYPKECTPGCTTYCSHLMYSSLNTCQSSCYLEDDINFLNF